jgi:hypothetical protein
MVFIQYNCGFIFEILNTSMKKTNRLIALGINLVYTNIQFCLKNYYKRKVFLAVFLIRVVSLAAGQSFGLGLIVGTASPGVSLLYESKVGTKSILIYHLGLEDKERVHFLHGIDISTFYPVYSIQLNQSELAVDLGIDLSYHWIKTSNQFYSFLGMGIVASIAYKIGSIQFFLNQSLGKQSNALMLAIEQNSKFSLSQNSGQSFWNLNFGLFYYFTPLRRNFNKKTNLFKNNKLRFNFNL